MTVGAGGPSGNLGDLIPRGVGLDQRALVDLRPGGAAWTYRDVDTAAQQVGALLLGRFARGDRVALVADNSAEFVCAYLGILRAGLVAVPISTRMPAAVMSLLLEDAEAVAVMADAASAPNVPGDRPLFRLDDASIVGQAAVWPLRQLTRRPSPGEIAEILYTSGSTGRPKGVPLSHEGQVWALSAQSPASREPGQRTLIVAPLFHMNGLFNLSLALASGVEVVLQPTFNARLWLQAIADHRCTTLSGIATMFLMAARETDLIASLDLSSVKRVKLGSAPLSAAQVQRVQALFPGALITNGYGTTEVGASVFGEHPEGKPRPPLSVGYPRPETAWRFTDGGEAGVLELKTPAMFDGYLNLPLVTQERLRDGWYVTGDIMRHDAEGFFHFVGRADDMFICGGENIYPAEVEQMLARHPQIAQAAVAPAPDLVKGQIPIAFVVAADGAAPSAEELKAYALRHGPAYSHPRAFVVMDALPLSGVHKIDRAALLARAEEVARALDRS
jgi:acyl-CoA synthetase (AMP-forming)/AMP-acid ligase II